MRNKSVAVLDVRSAEICAAVAEKGVNNTFIIKSKYSARYDGYAEGELLDVKSFRNAIKEAVNNTFAPLSSSIREVYVGIPGEFTSVEQTDKVISFSSTQRITSRQLNELTRVSMPEVEADSTIVKCSPLYYVLSDNRKVISPLGQFSDGLRGRLSFFVCRTAFLECVQQAFEFLPNIKVFHWLPQIYSQAMYLVEPYKRDGYAAMLDLGEISSSYSVLCGNGVAFSESFSVGIAHVAVLLMEALDIPYDAALGFIKTVNLNARDRLEATAEYSYEGKIYSFPAAELRNLIREGLDGLCEMIETCRQAYVGKDLSGKPLLLTGDGVGVIRGTTEHLSSRLVLPVEVIAPKLPYYDKPKFSSLFSLLDSALK